MFTNTVWLRSRHASPPLCIAAPHSRTTPPGLRQHAATQPLPPHAIKHARVCQISAAAIRRTRSHHVLVKGGGGTPVVRQTEPHPHKTQPSLSDGSLCAPVSALVSFSVVGRRSPGSPARTQVLHHCQDHHH
ncbi:uncharacterized protein LOC135110611 [Scylla paramamosain]|uniref:uncharacterized protein LOC135110611 n=1 Tax=Scylla paramamosain TaxID=85552 RepID=UPI0030832FF2